MSEAGARYATAAHLDPENPTVYRFRPDAAGVVAYMRRISDVPLETVTVTPGPGDRIPGDADHRDRDAPDVSFGPLAGVANGLPRLVGADPPFPGGRRRDRPRPQP